MSYTVTLKDGKTYGLDDEEGASLKDHWLNAAKPFTIELGDDAMSSTEIKRISKNPVAASSMFPVAGADRMLAAGNECRGTRSINLEVIRMANQEKNPKLLKDTAWRKRAKDYVLATQPGTWCDQEAGTCACPPLPQTT